MLWSRAGGQYKLNKNIIIMDCKNCGHAKGVHARNGECHFGPACKCKQFVQHGTAAAAPEGAAEVQVHTDLQAQITEVKTEVGNVTNDVATLKEDFDTLAGIVEKFLSAQKSVKEPAKVPKKGAKTPADTSDASK